MAHTVWGLHSRSHPQSPNSTSMPRLSFNLFRPAHGSASYSSCAERWIWWDCNTDIGEAGPCQRQAEERHTWAHNIETLPHSVCIDPVQSYRRIRLAFPPRGLAIAGPPHRSTPSVSTDDDDGDQSDGDCLTRTGLLSSSCSPRPETFAKEPMERNLSTWTIRTTTKRW